LQSTGWATCRVLAAVLVAPTGPLEIRLKRLHSPATGAQGPIRSAAVTQLLITQTMPGVAKVTSTDPFSSLELYRIDRDAWHATPAAAGIYLLYGFVQDAPAVYIGMSTTSIRDRVRTHHVAPKKDWFGLLFAIPILATTSFRRWKQS